MEDLGFYEDDMSHGQVTDALGDWREVDGGWSCGMASCEKELEQGFDFMIRLSNASREGWAGLIIPARAKHEKESWVVDSECVITVQQGALHKCNLCI